MLREFTLHLLILVCFSSGSVFSEDAQSTDAAVQEKNLESLVQQIRPSVATINVSGRDGDSIAMGTGFVIEANGLIATNFHVISEGRPFKVEMSSGRDLPVLSIESSDRTADLALIRVDVKDEPLIALPLSDADPSQGMRVLAFGNPLGLRDSVVEGIVSAVREVEGRELIQLAMPVERGNSGGPLVDSAGNVVGIINMKSAIDDNLAFAIPIDGLATLRAKPNPVTIDRWVRLGRLNEKNWTPLFGATWKQRGGLFTARGLGNGFGGRSLCLATESMPELPLEIAVRVRLDDESGAAGIAFHSDGQHRHYGFYPSNGRLRLTCFKGPSVYSWQVLEEVESEHYASEGWNRIRVRIEKDRLKCFVNGNLVIESTDQQLTAGKFGLVKFRDTNPDFKGFQFGADLPSPSLTDEAEQVLTQILEQPGKLGMLDASQIGLLGGSGEAVARKLAQHATELENRAEQLRRLALEVELAPTLDELRELMSGDEQLLRGTLLIAKLDNPDIDIPAYTRRIDEMAEEIRESLGDDADENARRESLHRYLFEENGFHGGRAEYYHPANSHLNRVIDEREGLPITLSILYMELGQRLGLKIEGVGLPGHFVVKHVTDDDEQLIDVFERGKLLSREDAEGIVAAYTRRELVDDDLRAQSVVEILSRVLNNLMGIASGKQDTESINRYCEALVAVDPASVESRMMRSQIRAMTDRLTGAIEDLDWLIDNDPPGFNRTRAQQLRSALIKKRNGG